MTAFFEADDAMEFFRAIKTNKELSRRFTMHAMVSTMLGIDTPVIAPLQSKRKVSRAAEIALTYGAEDWCRGPYVSAVYTQYKTKGGQRQASEFDRVGAKVAEDGNEDLLVQDLVHVQSSLNDLLQRAYNAWREQVGKKEDDERRKLLSSLRDHQATKVGKHSSGKFYLLERMRDGEPMLLISSDPKKDIDKKYITAAQGLVHPKEGGGAEVRGFYKQDIKAKTLSFFAQKGTGDAAVMAKALRALKRERKVTKVNSQDDLE